MKISKSFLALDFAGSSGAVDVLVREATRFFRRVASDMHLSESEFTIREDRHSGEDGYVALHADALYVHIRKAPNRAGIAILYRTCRGRDDHAGGKDNFVSFTQLMSHSGYQSFLSNLRLASGLKIA
ncbi:conserved protein of unknown function (plasmid) [Pararobbsia alpina]|uniref:hypothetical protein n=1 Tax=Pararobbsia alpina TaxID=621374 RepID=UPI0039A626CB